MKATVFEKSAKPAKAADMERTEQQIHAVVEEALVWARRQLADKSQSAVRSQ